MRTCSCCDEEMVPSTSRIRVFSAMECTTPLRVDANECPSCGIVVPAEGAVEAALQNLEGGALAAAC